MLPAERESLEFDPEAPFQSEAFRRFQDLCDRLQSTYGYLTGDVNWSGVLNLTLDLRGQNLFLDMIDDPYEVRAGFARIAEVVARFVSGVQARTGTSSISVNRVVHFFDHPIRLHSECSNTMIAADDYERSILPIDAAWSSERRPFGIHHCCINLDQNVKDEQIVSVFETVEELRHAYPPSP